MYILSAICSDYALASVLGIIKRIITILQIVVPIFLIIGGSITFSKALINPDDGPKAKKKFSQCYCECCHSILDAIFNKQYYGYH